LPFVPERIHRLPEAFVEIDTELPIGREPLHRLLFPDSRVAVYVPADGRRQDEEAVVNPTAVAYGLLLESDERDALGR
jgi:hypothetical protein